MPATLGRIVERVSCNDRTVLSAKMMWSGAQGRWVNGRRMVFTGNAPPLLAAPAILWYEIRRIARSTEVAYEAECHLCGSYYEDPTLGGVRHFVRLWCAHEQLRGEMGDILPHMWSGPYLSAFYGDPLAARRVLQGATPRRASALRDYSYKPEPEFHFTRNDIAAGITTETGPFMGFELEMECNEAKQADIAYQLTDHFNGLVYCKRDGSLDKGVEMVTHPGTIDFWRTQVDWSVLSAVADQGVRAWDAATAGLHIHLNVGSFKSRSHFARFYMLFQRNHEWWIDFAGRHSRYAQYDACIPGENGTAISRAVKYRPYGAVQRRLLAAAPPEPSYYGTPYSTYDRMMEERRAYFEKAKRTHAVILKEALSGVRGAVNCQNSDTVEVRLFRPSLRWTTVVACLEAVHAAWEYTRDLGVVKDKDASTSKVELLLAPAWSAWIRSNAGRYPFLAERVAKRVNDGEEDYGF